MLITSYWDWDNDDYKYLYALKIYKYLHALNFVPPLFLKALNQTEEDECILDFLPSRITPQILQINHPQIHFPLFFSLKKKKNLRSQATNQMSLSHQLPHLSVTRNSAFFTRTQYSKNIGSNFHLHQ